MVDQLILKISGMIKENPNLHSFQGELSVFSDNFNQAIKLRTTLSRTFKVNEVRENLVKLEKKIIAYASKGDNSKSEDKKSGQY